MKDIIPKQVICHLVNETVKRMNSQLIKGLEKFENKKEMLEEDPNDKFEREKLGNNVTALSQALQLIEKVRTDPKGGNEDIMKSNIKYKKSNKKEIEKKKKQETEEEKVSEDD